MKTKHSPINQISGIHYQSIVSHARRPRRKKSSSWKFNVTNKNLFLLGIATKRTNTTVDKNRLLSSSKKGIESFHFLVHLSTIMIRRPWVDIRINTQKYDKLCARLFFCFSNLLFFLELWRGRAKSCKWNQLWLATNA